jgi:hypothetical protein
MNKVIPMKKEVSKIIALKTRVKNNYLKDYLLNAIPKYQLTWLKH